MKRFLLLVLAAFFVMLQFSCSDEGFKAPSSGGDASASEKIPCIVNEQCYEISRSTCSLMGGTQGDSLEPKIESCRIPVDWIEPFKLEINDSLYLDIKGIVQINSDSPELTLDSIYIKGSSGYNESVFAIDYEPVAAEGELSYNFERVTPIDLSRDDISCEDSIKIAVYIYAGGKSTTKPVFGKVKKPKIYCKDPYPIPDFTCEWDPRELKYGKKAVIYLQNIDPGWDPNCKSRLYALSNGDTTWLDSLEYTISTKNGFPKMGDFSASGVVVCEDPTRKGNLHKDCEVLTIEPVPEPIATGELSFKKSDYAEGGEDFYFIGTQVTKEDIESSIEITNKNDVVCGEIDIRITGSTAAAGDTVTATAFVVCGEDETEYELGNSISATVLPNPVVGECSFTNSSPSATKDGDTWLLRSSDSLFLKDPVIDNYGRCNVEHSLTGASGSFAAKDTLLLNNSGGQLLNKITTRASCGSNPRVTRECSEKVSVVSYIDWTTCGDNKFDIKKGQTILEFACDENKGDYYIRCDGGTRPSFTLKIDGGTEGIILNGGDNGYNVPNLQTIKEGDLYRYPKSILVDTKEESLKCTIW